MIVFEEVHVLILEDLCAINVGLTHGWRAQWLVYSIDTPILADFLDLGVPGIR